MGPSQSQQKVEEEFEVFRVEREGSAIVKSRKDGRQYLMRVVNCASEADLDRLKALLECRARLKSQHLLELVEIKQKQQDLLCSVHFKMYLVLEYSSKSLRQEIAERAPNANHFQESDLWSILYSCCAALNMLYSNGATHESLTAAQVFINRDGFVKIAEPLLFGLQKNHLQAMRREEGSHLVHLSPEIISCIDDQNFFYYNKEKSDVFVLAMILIDAALLANNYLYDPNKKLQLQQTVEGLLARVAERYSSNLVGVIADMLRIQARARPSLLQVIERVEKFNNVGEEFTVESESNIRPSDRSFERGRVLFDRPINYQGVVIHEKKKTEPIAPHFCSNGLIQQQPSLSIKEPSLLFNNQNFDGKVFASTSHHSNLHSQHGLPYNYQQETNILPFHPLPVVTQRNISKPPQILNLYERSRSIDSIKVVSNDYSTSDLAKPVVYSASKQQAVNFTAMAETARPPHEVNSSSKREIIFTHQIPQVYNLLVRNSASVKTDNLVKQTQMVQPSTVISNRVHAESNKNIRFTSFNNFPNQTTSRNGDEPQTILQSSIPDIRPTFIPTQNPVYFQKQAQKTQQPFVSFKQVPSPFSYSTPFPEASPKKAVSEVVSSSPIVSASFIPNFPAPSRITQSFNNHSAFSHLNHPQPQSQQMKLQFVSEDIPDRGRYEGYKCKGEKNGHGALYFKDGGHYEGEWKDDKMHGFGKLYYENGTIAYEGYWQNDQFNGQGRVYNSDPVALTEQFNYKDFSQLGNNWIYYQGQFKNDSKHGKGYIKLTNGEMYEGIFDHDMIQGNGIFYKRGGEIIVGFWIDNKLFLNQSYEDAK